MLVLRHQCRFDVNSTPSRDSQQLISLALDGRGRLALLFERQLVHTSQAAILAHAPHVPGEEEQNQERQEETVQHVESQQSILSDLVAAQEQEANFVAYDRRGA